MRWVRRQGRPVRIMTAIVIAVVSLLLGAGASSGTAQLPKGSAGNPIRVGSLRIVGFAPSYLLPELGRQRGVYFEVIDFPRTTERLAALLRGDIDAAFAGWNGTILLAAKGEPVVAVSGSFNGGYSLLVRAESPIREVKDLRGKRVAHSIGSNAEIMLYSQLKLAGLEPRDVQAVHMGFPEMPIALARGDIDACFCSEPHGSIAIERGFARLLKYPYDAGFGDINGNLVVTREMLRSRPEVVEALLRVFVEAVDNLNKDQQRLFEVGKELFKQPDAVVMRALRNTRLDYRINARAVEAMAEWLLRLGQIQRKPPLAAFVDTRLLNRVIGERR